MQADENLQLTNSSFSNMGNSKLRKKLIKSGMQSTDSEKLIHLSYD